MCLHEGLGAHQCCHGCIMAPDFWGQGPGLWAGQGRHPAQEMSVEHRTMRFTGKGICRGLSKVPRSPVLCGGAESLSPLFGSSHSLGSGFRVPKCLGISMGGGGTHTLCTPPRFVFFPPLLSILQHQLPHLLQGPEHCGECRGLDPGWASRWDHRPASPRNISAGSQHPKP